MRLFRLLVLLLFIPCVFIIAQQKLSFDEALKLAYQNNIDLQKQSAKIQYADAALGESARLPNPIFTYTREDLNSGSTNYKEWIASGSIPLNFLWNRWSNLESKEKSLEAQKLLYNALKFKVSARVRESYFAFNKYSDLAGRLNNTINRLAELAEAAKHRLNEGDISEYELQRILIEVNKIKVTASQIELLKTRSENSLKLLTGYSSSKKIVTESLELNTDLNLSEEQLVNVALKNRNDLKSLEMLIESENSFVSHNQMKIIPDISLSAGYKKQTDDLKGTVFQIDFEVPLFNRNQMAIQQSEIEVNLLEKETAFLINKIKTEVSEAYQNYVVNKSLYNERNNIRMANILNTAVYSYEQGEINLVEFIDGINAFIDGSKLSSELEINLHKYYSQLEKAVGISLTNFEK
ncbi:MAG: TolC family protein [Ignavibacteriae bacterium]|nr:TolC family protein [Ignavibacteriota bacterium]NOG99764.1 TolC family protein [Ignavibacteriota bacterium]